MLVLLILFLKLRQIFLTLSLGTKHENGVLKIRITVSVCQLNFIV